MQDWKYEAAGDLDQPLPQRLGSVRREPGLFGWIMHAVSAVVTSVYLRVVHRLRVEGAEYLPDGPPAVIIANHSSHLDAATITVALPRRLRGDSFPLAADDYFFKSTLRSAFTAMFVNALPMRRGKAVRHAIADLRQRLCTDHCVLIVFPEGTRSRTGEMAKFKSGIGMLVGGLDVPVVPAWIDGAHRALPVGARWPKPTALRVRFGPALRFKDTPNKRPGWDSVAEAAHAAVADLAPSSDQGNRKDGV